MTAGTAVWPPTDLNADTQAVYYTFIHFVFSQIHVLLFFVTITAFLLP